MARTTAGKGNKNHSDIPELLICHVHTARSKEEADISEYFARARDEFYLPSDRVDIVPLTKWCERCAKSKLYYRFQNSYFQKNGYNWLGH
ncbi:MAG: hypothetical protein WA364_15175 [Candidatus Nitrosopolaris sp.]